jgi:hypothetical protein
MTFVVGVGGSLRGSAFQVLLLLAWISTEGYSHKESAFPCPQLAGRSPLGWQTP